MRSLRAILTFTLYCAALFNGGIVQAQQLPDRIASSRVIKIGVNPIYPPLESKNPESGKLVGFDVDLAEQLAKELGARIEWQEFAFEQLIPSLSTGRIDVILSGLNDRPARRETMDFVDYLNSAVQFYTLAASKEIQNATDFCGKTVATSRSTSFPAEIRAWSDKNCIAANKPVIEVEGVSDNAMARSQLKQQRFQGGAQGSETVPYIMQQEPNVYRAVGAPFGGLQMGIAFMKKDTALRDAFQIALKKLIANGQYAAIVAKWNLQSSAVSKVTINGADAP